MANTRVGNISVRVGEYKDAQGNTKGEFENVGTLMQSDNGGYFIIMKRTFNPAGVPNPDNRNSFIASVFNGGNDNFKSASRDEKPNWKPSNKQPAKSVAEEIEDDIPF